MMDFGAWMLIVGLAACWLGWQILWAAPKLPRQMRAGPSPSAAKGTPEAFGLFWMDQYGYIGLILLVGGLLLAVLGWLR